MAGEPAQASKVFFWAIAFGMDDNLTMIKLSSSCNALWLQIRCSCSSFFSYPSITVVVLFPPVSVADPAW